MKKINKHSISNSGFKTPSDYFDSFEERLLTELNLKEKVNNSGFKMPDSYLEDFKVALPNNQNKQSDSKVIPLFSKKTWLVAASIAAMIIFIITIPKNNTNSVNFANLDNETIEDFLLINDFESDELSNLITNTTAFENSIMEEALNDIHLDDYLYNNMELEDLNFE